MNEFDDVYSEVRDSLSNRWAGQMAQDKKTLKAAINSYSVEIENTTGKDLKIGLLIPAGINTSTMPFDGTNAKMPGGGKLAGASLSAADKRKVFAIDPSKINDVDAIAADAPSNIVYKETAATETAKFVKIISKGRTYDQFVAFVRRNPSVIRNIVVTANDQSFFGGEIKVKQYDPFDEKGSKTIALADFFSEHQQVDTRITIDTVKQYGSVIQMDDQTLIYVTMPGQTNGSDYSKATIQFNFGAVKNDAAKELKEWTETVTK